MFTEYTFALPFVSGAFVVMLMYVKHVALIGHDVSCVGFIGARMVMPILVGILQVVADLPVSGGTPATQVFAWIGVTITLTLLGEIMVLNIMNPQPPKLGPKAIPVEILE